MQLLIVATHSCSHRAGLERELRDLGYAYEIAYVEDNPDLGAKYGIRHSPNVIVDGTVICRGPVPEGQLRELIEAARLDSE